MDIREIYDLSRVVFLIIGMIMFASGFLVLSIGRVKSDKTSLLLFWMIPSGFLIAISGILGVLFLSGAYLCLKFFQWPDDEDDYGY